MRYRRSQRITRRITEAERSATEDAYLQHIAQQRALNAAREANFLQMIRRRAQRAAEDAPSKQMIQQRAQMPPQISYQRVYMASQQRPLRDPPGCVVVSAILFGLFLVGLISASMSSSAQPSPHSYVVTPPGGVYHNYLTPNPPIHGTPTVIMIGGDNDGSTGGIVVCNDGWVSHSGGRRGACSHHGGEP